MRIGMMVDLYKPHVSGVTVHVDLNKKFMEAAGHEVFIFTFGDKDHEDDEAGIIRSGGLPLEVPALELGIQINISYNRRARSLLKTMDVVHLHHPFISGTMALRYCRPRGIPIVFTNHTRYDLQAQAYLPLLPDTLGEAFLKSYLPPFCRACDLVITPSEGMRQVLHGFGISSHVEVVPNGVDLEPIRNVKDPIQRSEFGVGPEEVLLVYSGRLGSEKNLPLLLRSFAGVAGAYGNVHLVLVGDGPERDNLEDRVKHMGLTEQVHFTGMVPYEDIPRYLAAADAFVTASVSEVHPLTVIEAMAAGLPVLGIESPGVTDTVEDGVTGYLAKDDLAAFTAKLVRLVTDHEARKRMSEEARKQSAQYAIRRTSKILLDHYETLVDKANRRAPTLRNRIYKLFDRLGA